MREPPHRPAFRSLLVCDILPWRRFGGAMRCDTVARALAHLGTVDLLVLANGCYPVPDETPFARIEMIREHTAPDLRSRAWTPLAGPAAAHVRRLRGQLRREAGPWVRDTAYDVVWYSRERTWLKLRGLTSAPAVVDIDDLEDVLLRRWLALGRTVEGTPLTALRRVGMRRDARWWASVHPRTARSADAVVFASDHDRCRFGFPNSVTVPNTYEQADEPMTPYEAGLGTCGAPMILFQGALTWPPNEDAAVWLVEEIAPIVRKTHPGLRIVLAGSASARVRQLGSHPGVEVVGRVAAMKPYLAAADLIVVPLRVGGGTRIKILEAFSHGVPVVSTRVGAEGLDVEPGVHLEIADTAEGIAERCLRLIADPARRRAVAGQAQSLYERGHRAAYAGQRIHQAVELAVRTSAARR